MLALGASCPWFKSKYPYLNGLCSVIRLAQDICNVLEEFKSHKVHICFHVFIMLSFCLNPLLSSQRLKKLLHCSLVQWLRIVPLQGKGHRFNSYRSNKLWGFSFNGQSGGLLIQGLQVRILYSPQKLVGSLMVKYWSPKPADMGSNPIPSAIQGYSSMVRALP